MRPIPESAHRKDWPRLVARQVNRNTELSKKTLAVYIDGRPASSEEMTAFCPVDVGIVETSAAARVASSGTATFTLERIRDFTTTSIGTVVFAASATGVVTLNDPKFEKNDIFKITAPGSPDATLEDILITMRG